MLRPAARLAALATIVGLLLGPLLFAVGTGARAAEPGEGSVLLVAAEGTVTPVMASNVRDAVAEAEDGGHGVLVIRVDTPGGLVTSMQDIVKTLLNARVPVVVWVAPPGAKAASAGYVITTAAHVAAMAPGTNIGAATPVSLGEEGGEVGDKVINDAAAYAEEIARFRGRNTTFAEEATRDGRSIGAQEAAESNVVDLLAASRDELLREIDGMAVQLGESEGTTVTLDTAGAEVSTYEPSFFRRMLQWLADPNLAFIFLSIAPLAILYELANPGVGAGAAVGVILIVLALFSLSVLPINAAGIALLVLAIALFIGEAFVPGVGVLAAGGTVSLLLAGIFLFQEPTGIGVDLAVVIPIAVVTGVAAGALAIVVRRTWRRPAEPFQGSLEGAEGVVRRIDDDLVHVFVEGAIWRARSTGPPLEEGSRVTVRDRQGLELVVEPSNHETASGHDNESAHDEHGGST